MDKIALSFSNIAARIRAIDFPQVDLVVGIGRGGVVPASLVAFHLEAPLLVLQLNYRDDDNQPRYERPRLMQKPAGDAAGKRILLVDDVSVSGKTLAEARKLLEGSEITTFVLKGNADIVVFPEVERCVDWPWNVSEEQPVTSEPLRAR